MTPEELDEAWAKEARRIHYAKECPPEGEDAIIAARLAREGWTPPPPPVDPDVLAYRKWQKEQWPSSAKDIEEGEWDGVDGARGFLAGARMAREQEQERAKVLLATLDDIQQYGGQFDGRKAARALDAYKAGKEAGK